MLGEGSTEENRVIEIINDNRSPISRMNKTKGWI